MPAHSIPLATTSALFEEERARMRQAWRDYTESLFEDACTGNVAALATCRVMGSPGPEPLEPRGVFSVAHCVLPRLWLTCDGLLFTQVQGPTVWARR